MDPVLTSREPAEFLGLGPKTVGRLWLALLGRLPLLGGGVIRELAAKLHLVMFASKTWRGFVAGPTLRIFVPSGE